VAVQVSSVIFHKNFIPTTTVGGMRGTSPDRLVPGDEYAEGWKLRGRGRNRRDIVPASRSPSVRGDD